MVSGDGEQVAAERPGLLHHPHGQRGGRLGGPGPELPHARQEAGGEAGAGVLGVMIMLVFITYNEVLTLVNGILGALVGVTGGCAVFNIYRKCLVTKMWCLYHANVSWPSVQSAHSVTKHRPAQLDGGGRSGQLPGKHHPAPAGVGQGGRRGGYIVMSCFMSGLSGNS